MKPPAFDLLVAESVEEALTCLGARPGAAQVIAGGQSLMAMLNMRFASPEILVDISGIAELGAIRNTGSHLEIGAAVPQATVQAWPGLAEKVPLLALSLPHVGHIQTRNRGTVCGSLCHADPSAELPLVLATLGGEVVLRRRRGTRTLAAGEFQTGMLSTARRPDEILVTARFPVVRPGQGFAFREIARRHGDFAIVALAAVADGNDVRLGVGGVADRPVVRHFTETEEAELDVALNRFAWDLAGSDDIHASARYRRDLVRRIGRAVILEARHAAVG